MRHLRLLVSIASLLYLTAPIANAQQTGWTYLQDSVGVFCSSFQTSNSCSLGPGNILPTTAGSIRIVEVQSDVVSLIQSVCDGSGCTGTNDGWQHCASCTSNAIALGGHYVDVWYTQGTSGTSNNTAANVQNVVVKRSTANNPTIFGVNFYEVLPPPGSFGSFDTAANNPVSTCSTCTAVGLTLSATDFVLENADSGAPAAWNAWSSPFVTDWNANGIGLNIPSGVMAAPTVTYCTTACGRSATGHNLYAIAFKSSLGTFTPTAHTYSVISYAAAGAGGLNCSVSCTVSIGGTTRAGDLLYIVSFPNSLVSVSGASSGSGAGAWVVPASCVQTATLGGIGGSLSCAYVLSSNAGATTLTVKTNSSRASSFAVWEIGAPTGYTFTLDAIGAALNTGGIGTGGFQFLGEPLTISSNDVIFQNSWDPGGSLGPSLYAQPGIPCSSPCTNGNNASGPGNYFQLNEAASTVLLDSTAIQSALGLSASTAPNPIWMNAVANQNTVVSGTAFIATPPTIIAADCDSTSVQNALNLVVSDGTTVIIPGTTSVPCSSTWSSGVSFTANFSTTIQGGTTITGTCAPGSSCTATDSTTITNSTGSAALHVTSVNGKSVRITGLTFAQGTGAQQFVGNLFVSGGSQSVRVDHNHFLHANIVDLTLQGNSTTGNLYGVVDHNMFNLGGSNEGAIRVEHYNWNGSANMVGYSQGGGEGSWTDAAHWGSGQFMFIENNTFAFDGVNTTHAFAFDIDAGGGRVVFRFNNVTPNLALQTHGTGSGDPNFRGSRAIELYGNNFQYVATTNTFQALELESGGLYAWNNTWSNYTQMVQLDYVRSTPATYQQSSTPGGWGYCSTSPINSVAGPSPWDVSGSGPCVDQTGRGAGDLIHGTFPSKVNVTQGNTIAWPNQASEPSYLWGNTLTAVTHYVVHFASGTIQANSDYYTEIPNIDQGGTFNGTVGVGCGPLSGTACSNPVTRPATCTAGVGYWDPAQNTLFQCNPTNTWVAFYTPFTYPHPLTSGVSSSIAATPNPLTFGNQRQGVTSSPPLTLTVTNNGSTALTLSTPYFSISGANAADFTNTGAGTCANGLTLTIGQSCTITLVFTPITLSPEAASILINGTDNVVVTGIGTTTTLAPHVFALNNLNRRSKDGR